MWEVAGRCVGPDFGGALFRNQRFASESVTNFRTVSGLASRGARAAYSAAAAGGGANRQALFGSWRGADTEGLSYRKASVHDGQQWRCPMSRWSRSFAIWRLTLADDGQLQSGRSSMNSGRTIPIVGVSYDTTTPIDEAGDTASKRGEDYGQVHVGVLCSDPWCSSLRDFPDCWSWTRVIRAAS